jgi:hypothetical protein
MEAPTRQISVLFNATDEIAANEEAGILILIRTTPS